MNIFFLDKTPEKSAQYLCDKHVPKMLLESCQMLSTALRQNGYEDDYLYKSAYSCVLRRISSNTPSYVDVGEVGI